MLEALLYLLVSGGEGEGEVLKPQKLPPKKTPCVFNLSSLAPSTLCSQMLQKIIPLCFFPWFSGNDLTTARKRNVKHSLELFMTSARRGGPCSSASLDIPEHTQHKFPTAGVDCCFSAAPKQSRKKRTVANIWVFAGLLGTLGVSCLKINVLKNAVIDSKGHFPSITH